jgi:hypothetical protein
MLLANEGESFLSLNVPQTLKAAVHKILPEKAGRKLSALWHFRGRFPWALKIALTEGRPNNLIYFGISPGDDLLCTAVLHELASRHREKIWMMSNYPELFAGNASVAHVVPVEDRYREYAGLLESKYEFLQYAAVRPEQDMSVPPARHIIAELCASAKITGRVALRPYFFLTETEKKKYDWAQGMIAIQSSGLAAKLPMRNKQWFPERFQAVISDLKRDFKFVQLGSAGDPPLTDVIDLRGKTSIRESAAVLANCRLHVGTVGFLMHLARAVECPAVIIFGGREAPWQSGYGCNVNLYSAVPCAPCWLWNRCDYNRLCMDTITAQEVIRAVEQIASQMRNPLKVDYFEITPEVGKKLSFNTVQTQD